MSTSHNHPTSSNPSEHNEKDSLVEKPENKAFPYGLDTAEAQARRARGLGNNLPVSTSRTYTQILRENVFTFINNVLFGLGIGLVLLGRPSDAIISVFVILVNVVISVTQEIRAKRLLDKIALLTRPHATIFRDGKMQQMDPAEIVVGDALVVNPGDQILVDGQMIGEGRTDIDESLLTGESDLVRKRSGDPVYSGSFCVTGSGIYEAQKVGAESFANRLTSGARVFRRVHTPLQREINLLIRIILLIAVYLEVLFTLRALLGGTPLVESVRMSVVIAGLVPNGLLLTIAVAYALGAVRIAGKGALVQQANAVESLSNVDTLCLDKTGTLTTNNLKLHALEALHINDSAFRTLLGDFVASFPDRNRTAEAIAEVCPAQLRRVAGSVPFSSVRKWSALAISDEFGQGTYALGAPEMLRAHLSSTSELDEKIEIYSRKGLRVLLFAGLPRLHTLQDAHGEPQLPRLDPLGLVILSDELRPDAQETLRSFTESGVQIKIISGDSPHTVAALARQAGMGEDIRVVSGTDLTGLDDEQLADIAEETTVFGRITPQQKEKLVQALRQRGHYVAMIGDGVNDVLSLKQANLGIAMQSGSQAARSVADIVLLGDAFSALAPAVREGQRIINGMQDIFKLYLTRVFYAAMLITAVGVLNAFAFTPKENSLMTLMTVGLPTLALAAWAKPARTPTGNLVRSLLHFVTPAMFTLTMFALGIFATYLLINGGPENPDAVSLAQTAMTTFNVFCGLMLVVFAEPPIEMFTGGDILSNDWRPTFLVGGLFLVYSVVLFTPWLRGLFELTALNWLDFAIICAAVACWAALLRLIWRRKILERFLDMIS